MECPDPVACSGRVGHTRHDGGWSGSRSRTSHGGLEFRRDAGVRGFSLLLRMLVEVPPRLLPERWIEGVILVNSERPVRDAVTSNSAPVDELIPDGVADGAVDLGGELRLRACARQRQKRLAVGEGILDLLLTPRPLLGPAAYARPERLHELADVIVGPDPILPSKVRQVHLEGVQRRVGHCGSSPFRRLGGTRTYCGSENCLMTARYFLLNHVLRCAGNVPCETFRS